MGKDPAFLFYPGDWLGGTMGMTFEEKGAYITLLMLQFNRGHMTEHMIGQTIGQLWDSIKFKFIQDKDGLYYNERLDIEKDKRRKFVESRRNNIEGTNQYTKRIGHMKGHKTTHMEDEDKNRDIINNVIEVYNNTSFTKLQKLTDKRKTYLNARIKEHGEQCVVDVIIKASKSDFLRGINERRWKADFDWLVNPNNFVKVMEGKYDNKKPMMP